MSTANIVCGSCGAALAQGETVCHACGSSLAWTAASAGTTIRCNVCGHQNSPGAETCASCGAKLGGAGVPAAGRRGQAPQPARTPKPSQSAVRRRFEPWQLASVISLIALVGVLLYYQLRPSPSTGVASAVPPSGMPTQGAPTMRDVTPFQEAVDANPSDARARLQLANVLQDNGAYERAAEEYRKYLQSNPRDPDARVDLGICFYQLSFADSAGSGRYLAMAKAEMEQAHRDTPTHQPAVFNLGVVLLRMGDLQGSNNWFKEAVRLNPSSDLGRRAQQLLTQHTMPQ